MSVDTSPGRAQDQLSRTSAACHEPGYFAAIRPFDGRTGDGFVGSVDACNLRRVLQMKPWPQNRGLVGFVGVVDLAGWSVCPVSDSGRDRVFVASYGKNWSAGYIEIAENEAVHSREPASEASSEISLANRADPNDLGAQAVAMPGCFGPLEPVLICYPSLFHGFGKLHAFAGSIFDHDLHLIGSCCREQVLGLMAVC